MTPKVDNKKGTDEHNRFNPFEPSLESESYKCGRYGFGDVVELSYLHTTNFSNHFHEMGHYALAKSTLWGITIKYLTSFAKYDERIKSLVEVMKDACEEVFESYSISLQYLFAVKSQEKSEIQRLKNSLYYQIYNKDYFNIVESFPVEQIVSVSFHARLARLALGVKLDDIYNSQELKHTLIENPQMYPDKRFRELVLSLKELLCRKEYTEITDEEILLNCNLTSYEQKTSELYDYCIFLKNKLLNSREDNQNLIQKISECEMVIVSTPLEKHFEDIYNDIAIPVAGGEHYKTEYLESIPSSLCFFNVMMFLFDNKNKDLHICIVYNTYYHVRYLFFFQEKDFYRIFDSFEGELIIQYSDLEKYQSINKQRNRRVFCLFPIRYSDFKKCLEQYAEFKKSAYIHRLHPSISAIFVKGKNNFILFSPQFFFMEPEIRNDIKNGYYNFIDCELFQTDGIFYCSKSDGEKYDSVLKAIFMAYHIGYRVPRKFLKI